MKIENIEVMIDGENVFIVGVWTLPITAGHFSEIMDVNYAHDVNDGLFEIPDTDKICLSVMPDDVAKIALTKDQIKQIRNLLNIN